MIERIFLLVDEFFQPSAIYASTLLPWIYKGHLKGISTISTGGLHRGVAKLLPNRLAAEIDASKWELPSVYGWLAGKAQMSPSTILHNFNCGIGLVIVVSQSTWSKNKFDGAIQIGKRIFFLSHIQHTFSPLYQFLPI